MRRRTAQLKRVARRSYGKLLAFIAARTRDAAAAEDALSEAFAGILAAAWLSLKLGSVAADRARRKMIDAARRALAAKLPPASLQLMVEGLDAAPEDAEIPDRRPALMFASAHPAIEADIRAPLILQVVDGLEAMMIASAFLMSRAAMGKRLVRAKEKIRRTGIPFSIPEREELPGRLDTVLDAIHAAFAEGWTDPGGTDVVRRELTGEAMFLARIVTELLPEEPEALGLLALMLYAEARCRARRSEDGEYVPLAHQDTELWDWRVAVGARLSVQHGARQLGCPRGPAGQDRRI